MMHDDIPLTISQVAQREVYDMTPGEVIKQLQQHDPAALNRYYQVLMARALAASRSSSIRVSDITDRLLGILIHHVEAKIANGTYNAE